MSTEELRQCLGSDVRDDQRRRNLPELDLNYPPPDGNMAANSQEYSAEAHRDSQQEIGDCVEVIDDDLAITNQRIFAEAKNKSRRQYSQVTNELREVLIEAGGLLDTLSEMAMWYIEQRRNTPEEAISEEDYIMNMVANSTDQVTNFPNLEAMSEDDYIMNMLADSTDQITNFPNLEVMSEDDCIMNMVADATNQVFNFAPAPIELPQTPPVPEAPPTFNCPICMGPLIEATTTKCGHIFCKECIKAAIAAQGKCPNCRQKLGKRGIIRIYLPTTS